MRVLLTRDLDNLGQAGDVVDVASGYGRNYLLPQGLAVLATLGAMAQRETYIRAQEERRERELAELHALAARVEAVKLSFRARVGESGRLYGSITNADIAQALSEELEVEIEKRKVQLEEPIKQLGPHAVTVDLGPELKAQLQVVVAPEETEEEPQAAEA